ncbi:unnamed protein product [Ectocarpus sp. 12 AP-2014]
MDKALLGVEWRFLAHVSDDEPGFSTAWLQQKSLKREADCREREYRNGILAGFANEFGMTSIFPSRRLEQGVDEDDAEGDDVEEEHDHVVCNKKGPCTSSWTAPSTSLPHRDLPILPEDPPISTVVKTPALPALVAALKKGGVRVADLQGGESRHAEDTGSWDGVDLASSPCLQQHMVGDNIEDVESAAGNVDAQGRVYGRPGTAQVPIRPSTPPTLLVYKPCISIKVADNVPSELQAMSKLMEMKEKRVEGPSSSETTAPRPSSEVEGAFERSAMTRLKIGMPMKQLSPTRPNGSRSSRSGGRAMRKKGPETLSEAPRPPTSLQNIPREPASHRTPYGKAWYINPELWGLGSSPQVESEVLGEESDNADGAEQPLAHTKWMKERIPGLFSAIRFAKYIRQQGVRMPAHLESTDNAMKAEEARVRPRRQARTARQDQDGPEEDVSAEDQENAPAPTPTASRSRAWRARVDAAMVFKKERKRDPDEKTRERIDPSITAPIDRGRQEVVIRAACSTAE